MNCPTCNTHVLEHPASRCLDSWIAEEVMGWQRVPASVSDRDQWKDEKGRCCYTWNPCAFECLHFSASIAAAWLMVERMRSLNDHVSVDVQMDRTGGMCWVNVTVGVARHDYRGPYWQAEADTVPLAICRAALISRAG